MRTRIQERLERLTQDLQGSAVALPLTMKLRTAELILRLMARRGRFGLYVILGWQNRWRQYLDRPDSEQDIFAQHRLNLLSLKPGERRRYDVAATVDFDGAILIDKAGYLIHSGVLIEGMRPRFVAEKVNPGRFADLSEQFGFETKVHTRHLTAIASSYVFPGTTVFTVSEETGAFHVFEGGRIIYSG